MKRREFITLLGGAAAVGRSRRVRSRRRVPVIGFLNATTLQRGTHEPSLPFAKGLNGTGLDDGQNVTIEYRSADDQYDRLAAMAADLVRRQVSVIAAAGTAAAVAAKAATTTIPTVFAIGRHPVQYRPGGQPEPAGRQPHGCGQPERQNWDRAGRATASTSWTPLATTFAALINPTSPNADHLSREMPAAARTLGLQLHLLYASTEHDFDAAFAILRQAGGLVICPDVFFIGRSQQLAALALRHKLPSVFQFRDFVEGGGLMSYGGSITDDYRLVGVYAGRILKGEKPADLPVQQADEIRADHQHEDRQGAWPYHPAHAARPRRRGDRVKRREFITLLGGALSAFHCVSASAQEGYYGAGHDKWHQGFYSTLKRNDGQGSCCNLMDCRPTQSRMVGDHYEVKVDGEWMRVPSDKINNVVAPDGGAHVCAPRQVGPNKGVLFCVILPSEG